MEMITLLKANIWRKKGTFISILLLTAIITAMTASIFSAKDNYLHALENAFPASNCGDIFSMIKTERLTDELRESLENSELVERVEYYPALCANGISYGSYHDGNTQFMTKMREGISLYNEKLDGFLEEIPALQSGEIYLPLGLKSKLNCNVGDKVTLNMVMDDTIELKIMGFVQEPANGAMTIGWKQVFISNTDYKKIQEKYTPYEQEGIVVNITIMNIHQPTDHPLSPARFQRELNLETKFSDFSLGSLNKTQSIRYSTLMPDIVLDIVLAFVLFLFVIVLIVMSHSIGTEIEIDYVTLGILKSQGFTKGKIRLLFLFQYLLAQMLGILVGCLVSIPIERTISKACESITAVLPYKGLSIGKCLAIVAVILSISAILILVKTLKISRISPVRAISNGREEIYFDSRLNAPIFKKALLTSLSFRQFTSAKKRYLGSIFIAGLLAFSMITVNLTGTLLNSRSSLSAMGIVMPDLEIYFTDNTPMGEWNEIDQMIESYSVITEKNSMITGYASLNGENLMCQAYEYPEYIRGILKGRAPLYDNELLITEMVADILELEMGDELIVSLDDKEETFIISGIFQSTYDSGTTFAMSFEGAEKIGANTDLSYRYYILEDTEKMDEIANALTDKYGSHLAMNIYDESDYFETEYGDYNFIVNLLKVIIYSFSILFAFVVVGMVCAKTFTQERTDIGIYKAIGFTSRRLRFNFAVRFTIIAIIGSALGILLSIFFSAKMLGAILGLIGLSNVVLHFTFMSILIPVIAICLSFSIFAYFTSWKVKKVAIRELVVE